MDTLGMGGSAEAIAQSPQRPSLFVPTGLRAFADGGLSTSASPVARENTYEPRSRGPVADLTRTGIAHGALDSDPVTSSFMAPIFHLTSDDSTILAMEHNNHVKLLAISSSRLELLVTNTMVMPVIENQGVEANSDDPFATQQAPPLDVRLLNWDPAAHSVLVDRLRAPCTQLLWAPWQHGTYLGALSPGCFLHIYRYSHGRWALDASLSAADCIAFAFSCHFTVACACAGGVVRLYSRHSAVLTRAAPAPVSAHGGAAASSSILGTDGGGLANAENGLWERTGYFSTRTSTNGSHHRGNLTGHQDTLDRRDSDGTGVDHENDDDDDETIVSSQTDCLSVNFNDHGNLLVAGYADGSVRVFTTTHESRCLGMQVFLHEPEARCVPSFPNPCRQVAWAPSAGRSFLMLALVFPHRVALILFRRPLLTTAAAAEAGPASQKHTNTSGSGGAGGDALSALTASSPGAGGASSRPLTVIATASVACEEVAKLSWNTTGTRFVTSHTDSLVQAWVVQVAYKQEERGGENEPWSRDAARLYLSVSMRKISTVHPYHATGTR